MEIHTVFIQVNGYHFRVHHSINVKARSQRDDPFPQKKMGCGVMVVSRQMTPGPHTGQRSGSSGKTAASDFVAEWIVVEAKRSQYR
jgi:hypothetical protein